MSVSILEKEKISIIIPKTPEEIENSWHDLVNQYNKLVGDYNELHTQNRLLQSTIFGTKSEKKQEIIPGQREFFNEAEYGSKPEEAAPKKIKIKSHDRKPSTGRKPVSKDLPREEVVHDVPETERTCACCGSLRPALPDERSEEYHFVPAKTVVRVSIRKKYGPCGCRTATERGESPILTAKAPERFLPKSSLSLETIAFILTQKFVDGLPFYRQESILSRSGLDLGRATMCSTTINVARRLESFFSLMNADMRTSTFIWMDETVVQVLKESGRPPTSKSSMWVRKGLLEGKPIIIFTYAPSRSAETAKRILDGWKGVLHTDAYSGYDWTDLPGSGITHVKCWAHIRRQFFDAWKVAGKTGIATEAIGMIGKIYGIERQMREEIAFGKISPEAFVEARRNLTAPIFDEFRQWCLDNKGRVAPRMPIGKAIDYALNQMPQAKRYVEYFELSPDTNAIENAIRPFVIGRNNWNFFDTVHGAEASAWIYSLVETAKVNGHEPYRYLCRLFAAWPSASTELEKRALLPYNMTP